MVQVSLGEAFVSIIADMKELDKGLATAGRKISTGLQSIAEKADRVGKRMSISLTAPILAFAAATTRAALQFDNSMTQIISLVGVAEDEVRAMGQEVLKLSGSTARSPAELADALFFITSAGLRGKTAILALEASAQAAAIGLGETKQIADAVTSAMNAYAKSNLTAADATGILIAAVREGKAEAADIASAIGRVLAPASDLGVSFDQLGAAIASMTKIGINANEAVTALSGVFTVLKKPTEDANQALAEVGLTAAQLRRQLREEGLIATLFTLRDAVGENETLMARIVPNVRALVGVLSLVGDSAEATAATFEALADAGENDLARAFEIVQRSAGFRFSQSLTEINTVMTEMGGEILPFVNRSLQQTARVVRVAFNAFNSLSPAAKDAAIAFAGFLAAAGPVIVALSLALSGLATVIKILTSRLLLIPAAAIAGVAALDALVVSAGSTITFWSRFSELIEDAANDIGVLAQTGIKTLIDAFVDATGSGDELKEAIDQIQEALGRVQEQGEGSGFAGGVATSSKEMTEAIEAANLELKILEAGLDEAQATAVRTAAAAGVLGDSFQVAAAGSAEQIVILRGQLADLAEILGKVKKEQDEVNASQEKSKEISRDLGIVMESAFENAVVAGESLRDVLQGLFEDLTKLFLRKFVTEPIFGALFGSGNSAGILTQFIPGLAHGGRAQGGEPAIVGERGPELFIPGSSGEVISNRQLGSMSFGEPVMIQQVQIFAPPGSQVTEERSQNGDMEQVRVFISETVSQGIQRTGSPINSALNQTFGLNRQLVSR